MTAGINKINASGCVPQGGQYRNAAVVAISSRVYPANDPETVKRSHSPGRIGNTVYLT
jgi:hypothetical protein